MGLALVSATLPRRTTSSTPIRQTPNPSFPPNPYLPQPPQNPTQPTPHPTPLPQPPSISPPPTPHSPDRGDPPTIASCSTANDSSSTAPAPLALRAAAAIPTTPSASFPAASSPPITSFPSTAAAAAYMSISPPMTVPVVVRPAPSWQLNTIGLKRPAVRTLARMTSTSSGAGARPSVTGTLGGGWGGVGWMGAWVEVSGMRDALLWRTVMKALGLAAVVRGIQGGANAARGRKAADDQITNSAAHLTYCTLCPSARSARYTSAGVCTASGLATGSHVSISSPLPPPLMADSRATRMRPP